MIKKTTHVTGGRHSNTAKQVITYWRHSLADKDRMGFMQSGSRHRLSFDYTSFKKAELPKKQIIKLFLEADEKKKEFIRSQSKYNSKKFEPITSLEVLIAPFHLVKKHYHGISNGLTQESNRFYPLIIPAKLYRDGKLTLPENESLPWVDRRCLRPNDQFTKSPYLGSVFHSDEYYDSNDLFGSDDVSWDNYFEYSINLFKHVVHNCEENDLMLGEYITQPKGVITPYSDKRAMSRNLLKTYDELISNPNKISKLMHNFCSLNTNHSSVGLDEQELLFRSQDHLGQMHSKYPLSQSQRIALSHFYDKSENDIFTINGPPGTGKTTMLLSVIVSRWIESIINEECYPPIIVAASTNNQAVINILDHFSNAHTNENSIRWLPDIDSFGLYLVSSSDIKTDYLHIKRGKCSGSVWEYIDDEYNARAKKYYLDKFNRHFNFNYFELGACVEYLKDKILEKSNLLKQYIKLAADYRNIIFLINQSHQTKDNLFKSHQAAKDSVATFKDELYKINDVLSRWLKFKSHDLFWLRLFHYLPIVKSMISERVKLFIVNHLCDLDTIEADIPSVDMFINEGIISTQTQLQQAEDRFNELDDVVIKYKKLELQKDEVQTLFKTSFSDEEFTLLDERGILATLDTSVRYELFELATHYWEAQWLIKSQDVTSLRYDKHDRKIFWATHAMLTPCFVTTLHTGPSFFQYLNAGVYSTLTNFIDLLIIDEAGQTLPMIAGSLVSVSKKLLLVGDIMQIEPIVELPQGVDAANAKKYIVEHLGVNFDELKESGILNSGDAYSMHSYGNLMVVGQRRAKFKLTGYKQPGLMLKEHRRCDDSIISYCNQLAYDNQLVPMVGNRDCGFPPMGYAHIVGSEQSIGSSRCNVIEARTIASWINKNHSKILDQLKIKNISAGIGIVTPFQAQASAIRKALKDENINIKVGTIHSFQGGEFPIIIFSPVYSSEKGQDHFFFDISLSMLNVAVSRAKMSFMVFGDMNNFHISKSSLPSSLLAKHLFSSEQNEIKDIKPAYFEGGDIRNIKQLINLAEHRAYLSKAFAVAKSRIIIVSPYLTVAALQNDKILEQIRKIRATVKVSVYCDPKLNEARIENFNQAKEMLLQAGAEVLFVSRVHSKLIIVDDESISIGSFNWLSSSRDEKYKLDEISIVYHGPGVSLYISNAFAPIEDKVYKKFKSGLFEPAIKVEGNLESSWV